MLQLKRKLVDALKEVEDKNNLLEFKEKSSKMTNFQEIEV